MKIKFLYYTILFPLFLWGQNSSCLESINLPEYTGSYEVNVFDESNGILNGSDYSGASIYYPINENNSLASIVIVPGFTNAESVMEDWGPFFASYGIVTMTIGTNSIFAQPEDRAVALLNAVNSLKLENSRITSPLYNLLDVNNIALGGWSMGGGGAILAAGMDTSIKAIVALCPWLNLLSGESLDYNVPTLIISGQIDVIAPPDFHADIHYELIPEETDKMKYEVGMGSHTLATSPLSGDGDVGLIALSWLKKYLIVDHCFCPLLSVTPTSASNFMSNVDCIIQYGCMNDLASNYNYNATVEDGSCIFSSMCNPIFINLIEGWNMLGFHCEENISTETTFSSIVEQVIIVKNGLGEAYLPEWNFNGIGSMQRGYGYSIKIKTSITDFDVCEN